MSKYLILLLLIFFMMIVQGCANEKIVLHSMLVSTEKIGNFKLDSYVFPETLTSGNYFSVEKVKGGISFTNVMLYQEETKSFTRRVAEPFNINIFFQKLDDGPSSNYLLTDLTGTITLEDGRVIKPKYVLYTTNTACVLNGFLKSDLNSNFKKNLASVETLELPILVSPSYNCLIFEYPEFISSERKFEFEIGLLKNGSDISKLNFKFVPMVVKSSTH